MHHKDGDIKFSQFFYLRVLFSLEKKPNSGASGSTWAHNFYLST